MGDLITAAKDVIRSYDVTCEARRIADEEWDAFRDALDRLRSALASGAAVTQGGEIPGLVHALS